MNRTMRWWATAVVVVTAAACVEVNDIADEKFAYKTAEERKDAANQPDVTTNDDTVTTTDAASAEDGVDPTDVPDAQPEVDTASATDTATDTATDAASGGDGVDPTDVLDAQPEVDTASAGDGVDPTDVPDAQPEVDAGAPTACKVDADCLAPGEKPAALCKPKKACVNKLCTTVTPKDGTNCAITKCLIGVCNKGACDTPMPPNCDDANACTVDSCNVKSGCVHDKTKLNGKGCGGDKVCQAGVCAAKLVCQGGPDCKKGGPCTVVGCDPSAKTCVSSPANETACTGNKYGSTCIKAFKANKSWLNAAFACTKWGGKLVSIHDKNENAHVASQRSKVCGTASGWIGLRKYGATFKWTDGKALGYKNWRPSEPNDGNDSKALIQADGKWWDASDSKFPVMACYVCERPISATCDDGDKCTTGVGLCKGGKCTGEKAKDCKSGNACAIGSCDAKTGDCKQTALKDGDKCDDGDPCNVHDACKGGQCVANAPTVKTIAGSGKWGSDDGPALKAKLGNPIGVAHNNGGYYISDRVTNKIRWLTSTGQLTTFAGSGKAGSKDGNQLAATFKGPADLAYDSANKKLWVADNANNMIRVVYSGKVWSMVGVPSAGYKEGKGQVARFKLPSGVALGPKALLYITDAGNHRVRLYDPSTNGTKLVAGSGGAGHLDGPADKAWFNGPRGIAVDASGVIYVTESNNQTVRRIASGIVTTIAGTPGKNGKGLGPAHKAAMTSPVGILIGQDGALFVSDYNNQRILRIFQGMVSLVIGHTNTNGDADGPLHLAKISSAAQMAWGPGNSIVFADEQQAKLKRLVLPGSFCDDNNACTADACDYANGACTNKPASNGDACDDGTVCTSGEACNAGVCGGGTKKVCVDGKDCTTDACDPKLGCVFKTIAMGGACEDGDKCTVGETCNFEQKCTGGKARNCDDGDPCGSDSCDKNVGCVHKPVAANDTKTCDDKNACTPQTYCYLGKCGEVPWLLDFAGTGNEGASSNVGNKASVGRPMGLTNGPDGRLWVGFGGSTHGLLTIDKDRKVTVLINGQAGKTDGPITKARLNQPQDLVWGDGKLYILDNLNHSIRVLDSKQNVTTLTGHKGSGYINSGTLSQAQFLAPSGFTRRADGVLVVADAGNNTVRLVDPKGGVKTWLGTKKSDTKDGPVASAELAGPTDVAFAADGTFYFSQTAYIRRVRKGTVTTIAGGKTTPADGIGKAAGFKHAQSIVVDMDGSLLVADRKAHAIRHVTDAGVVTTVTGKLTSGGFVGGAPWNAKLSSPNSIVVGWKNDIYIADSFNRRVRYVRRSPVNTCDDKNPCTVDTCDTKSGKCAYKAGKDGVVCGIEKVCAAGKCIGDPNPKGMTRVPAGSFHMGCAPKDTQCAPQEKPLHAVSLGAFWVDQREVTTGQYAACVAAGACTAAGQFKSGDKTFGACNAGNTGRDAHPINCVTWQQAVAYCGWRGKRLPTEAEWEMAARGHCSQPASTATCIRLHAWGAAKATCAHAHHTGCSKTGTGAVGVAASGKSAFGLLDMGGNVWEWTADWFDATYYKTSPAADPAGPKSGSKRAIRGGSFTSPASLLRASFRVGRTPTDVSDGQGFRCARD